MQTVERIGRTIDISLYVLPKYGYLIDGRYFKPAADLPDGIVSGHTYRSLHDGRLFAGRYVYDPNNIFTPIAFCAVYLKEDRLHTIVKEDRENLFRVVSVAGGGHSETSIRQKENGTYTAVRQIADSDTAVVASVPMYFYNRHVVKDLAVLYTVTGILTVLLYLLIRRHNAVTYAIAHAELKALQSQINPHFLYNSLDTINCIAIEHNHPEISAMVDNLIRFYRLSLNRGEDFVALKDEFEHIRCYLAIIALRYPDAVCSTLDYEPALAEERIPKLILQPLVENAVFHGILEKDIPKGIVTVRAYRNESFIMIHVEDDGAGMSEAAAKGLFKADSGGYGLKNVRERLRLAYGSSSGLSCTAGAEGTLITLRLYSPSRSVPKQSDKRMMRTR